MRRTVNGESCAFCCYGCCIAYQVKSGKSEEWEAAWLLIRLGVGGFLSMNIMMFSLLIYTDPFAGVDADMLPWIHLLLWLFATPAVVILGGPFLRETWTHATQGRLTASALDRARRRRRLHLFGFRNDRAQPAGLLRYRHAWC